MVIKVPAEKSLSVSLKTTTGNVDLGEKEAQNNFSDLKIQTSTGNIAFYGKTVCNNISVGVTTGEVTVIATENKEKYSYSYTTSAGKSNISQFALGDKSIDIHTSTGDINLYLEN